MLGISVKPVMRFVMRHGVDITHHPQASASADAPWALSSDVPPSVVLKGLIQRIRAESSPDMPQGGFRAVAVLVISKGIAKPRPGDSLEAEDQHWRIKAVLPLARHRSGEMVEASLVSYGEIA